MALATLQKQLIPQIEVNLENFLNSKEFGRSTELREMLAYHMGWKDISKESAGRGKRIRPFLTLLTAGSFDADIETAMPGALAVELLHNFTLIHDDIEDNAHLRHGRETLWQRWGMAQAINAGDALFSIAQIAILDLAETCDPETGVKAGRELNQVCLRLTRGQYLDIAFESESEIQVDAYLDMIRGKTAALIAFSTFLGGLSAGQDADTLSKLSEFGESLGMAFQIQDDYLGIWGDPAITGKSAASDLLTHKKTLPILYGLEKCPDFKKLWGKTQSKVEHVLKMSILLASCGAQAYASSQAEQYTNQAFNALERLFPSRNAYISALFELSEKLLQRES